MAALLTAQTTDTVTAGTATTASPAWIEVQGDSVMDGAQLVIETCSVNTPAKFSGLSSTLSTAVAPGWLRLDVPTGTFVRIKQSRSGAATSINANLL